MKPPPESEKPGSEIAVSKPGGTPKSSFFPTGKPLDNPPGKSGQTENRDFSDRPPLEIELLISEDARRPSAIEKQIDFRASISATDPRFDSIDRELDGVIVDPYAGDPPSRRSDKELGRLLDLLDSLETSKQIKTERGSL